jgi:hypothetical protein
MARQVLSCWAMLLAAQKGDPMNRTVNCCLSWTPRILCILFVALASLQAIHVLGEGYGTWKTILTLQSNWHRWGLCI